ncbi:hypothetical protein J4E08_02460 [Sagittula sp. NFXS13]|uniref:hypothetical protein n=1 Tax=Sagittula sp. NFXS13 TaxID=2819095 RepID=UPI0032DF26A7
MTQIDDMQARIMRALDRIGQGLESYQPGADTAEIEALQQKLTAAEAALVDAQENAVASLETAVEAARQEAAEAQEAALANARDEATAAQEEAIAAAVETALEQAGEAHEAALAAVRAEAQAAIAASAAQAPEAAPAEIPSEEWARIEDELRLVREALEDEKLANAQLTERMRHLKDKMVSGAPAEAPVAADANVIEALDTEVQRLRAANATLAESNTALREANAMGVGDTQLINKALAAELEAMRASRAVDAAEAEALLQTLEPLLAEAGANRDNEVNA